MADASTPPQVQVPLETRRHHWIARVEELIDQIAEWAHAENWAVERHQKAITEKPLGTYALPELIVWPPEGELIVNPIGLNVGGGNGRVDLEAIPTLSRVKLIGDPDGWQIWTDSNVPLRVEWNRDNFIRLVKDLLN